MVKKKCNKINCFNLISLQEKFCEKHKEENNNYDKQRYKNDKKIRDVYNSSRWRSIRKQVLMANNGLCSYCIYVNTYTRATLVDHFIPVRDAYEDRYNIDNLVSACDKCNTRKAVDEDKLRNKQITLEEFKHRWRYERE